MISGFTILHPQAPPGLQILLYWPGTHPHLLKLPHAHERIPLPPHSSFVIDSTAPFVIRNFTFVIDSPACKSFHICQEPAPYFLLAHCPVNRTTPNSSFVIQCRLVKEIVLHLQGI